MRSSLSDELALPSSAATARACAIAATSTATATRPEVRPKAGRPPEGRPGGARRALLATAATTRRRSVAARRALARVVQLVPPRSLGRLVGEAHHGVGQVRPPVLRHRGAAGAGEREAREQHEAARPHHSVPPRTSPARPEPTIGATCTARLPGANAASTTPTT